MRLSKVLSFFSKPVAFVAQDLRVDISSFYLTRISTAIASFFIFLIIGYYNKIFPLYLDLHGLFGYRIIELENFFIKLSFVLIFVHAFLGEVIVALEKTKKRKESRELVLSFFEQISDFLIVLGILIYLALRETYYNFGRFLFIDLSFIEPGIIGHAFIAFLFLIFLLALRFISNTRKTNPALNYSSERSFILFLFSFFGLYAGDFHAMVFTGIILIIAIMFISAFLQIFQFNVYEFFHKLANEAFQLLLAFLKKIRKSIGIALLWLYYFFEEVFEKIKAIGMVKESIRNIKLPEAKLPEIKIKSEKQSQSAVEHKTLKAEVKAEPLEKQKMHAERITEIKQIAEHQEEKLYIGESLLVEYSPGDDKLGVVDYIINVSLEENRSVLLILTQPAFSTFKNKKQGAYAASSEKIKLINLVTENITPTEEEIPVTKLEYFNEHFEELKAGDVVIFEPLSNLILAIDVASAYKFVAKIIERLSAKKITFIAFINKQGHEARDISNFENLFMHLAEIKDGKLRKLYK